MRTRTTVLLGVGAAVVVLGGAAVVFGPGLYADWSEDRAEAAPTLDAFAIINPAAPIAPACKKCRRVPVLPFSAFLPFDRWLLDRPRPPAPR